MYFQKLSSVSQTLDMTSEGLGEMFEGDFADICTKKVESEDPHQRKQILYILFTNSSVKEKLAHFIW